MHWATDVKTGQVVAGMSLPVKQTLCRVLIAVGVAAALAGCARDINPRGNLPPEKALAELAPGEQTRNDVLLLLGTPATASPFDGDIWYYISANTTQYAFYNTREIDRRVIALHFDERGILSQIDNLNLEDGHQVALAEETTPTRGRELGILEQLLGNVGRFSRTPGSSTGVPQP